MRIVDVVVRENRAVKNRAMWGPTTCGPLPPRVVAVQQEELFSSESVDELVLQDDVWNATRPLARVLTS
jgi:hypothetical protein